MPKAAHLRAVALLSLALAVGIVPQHLWAKSYRISRVDIVANLHVDGSMTIVETRTYQFRGRFSYATYDQSLAGTGGLSDIHVLEAGLPYRQDDSGEPGTFQVTQKPGKVEIRWHFSARNETRTFTLEYRVLDVVRVYPDVAELHFNFVGRGWRVPSGRVEIRVIPPSATSRDSVRAWAHGPLWGEAAIDPDGVVRLWVDNLPRRASFAGRVLYPPALFPEARNRFNRARLPEVLAEEARLAAEANARRQAARRKLERHAALKPYLAPVVVGLTVLPWLIWFGFYRRQRPHPSGPQQKYSSDLPEEPPALVNYLFNNKQLNAGALVATLFDLARRGFLTVHESLEEGHGLFSRRKRKFVLHLDRMALSGRQQELRDYEADLLEFLFDELATGDRISFAEIRRARSKVRKWFQSWKRKVQALWGDKPYYDRQSIRAATRAALLQLPVIAAGIYAVVLFGPVAGVAVLSSVAAMVMAIVIARKVPEVRQRLRRWRALRRYLAEYHKKQLASMPLDQVGAYLVYAVALGVPVSALKRFAGLLPADQAGTYLPWYNTALYSSSGGVGAAVASLTTIASSTLSSAAGVGGGASGAAAGAAGGSGGGAG